MPMLEINGRRVEVDDSFTNLSPQEQERTVDEIAASFDASPAQATPDTPEPSYFDRLKAGTDQALEGFSTTARTLGATGTADTLSGLIETPENYKSGFEGFIAPEGGFDVTHLDDAVAEQAPDFAGSMAARGAGALTGAAVAGPPGAVAGAIIGPTIYEFGQQLGPAVMERARNNGRTEPSWDDWAGAAATAGASGLLNAIGVGKLAPLNGIAGAVTKAVKRLALEGGTEGAQDIIQQTGVSLGTEAGLSVRPKDALGSAIVGGTTGGAGSLTSSASSATAKKALDKINKPYKVSDKDAATKVANRIRAVANNDKLSMDQFDIELNENSRDLDDDSRSRHGDGGSEAWMVLNSTHTQLAEETKAAYAKLRPLLHPDDVQTFDELTDKATVTAGQRGALNKLKGFVPNSTIGTIAAKTAMWNEGQEYIDLLKQSNELTDVFRRGLRGGTARHLEKFNPLNSPAMSTIAGIMTSGASTAAQAGVYGTARAADWVTGRRHPVSKFVRDFEGSAKELPHKPSFMADQANKKLALEQAKVGDRTERFQRQQAQDSLFKEGIDLTKSGQLTPQWIAQNRDTLKPAQYRTFLDALDKDTQALVKADERRLSQERQAVRDDLLKTATRLADTGSLTKGWIENYSDFLTPAEHKRLLDTVNKASKAQLAFQETMSKQQKAEASEHLKNLTTAMFRFGKQRQQAEQAEATQAETQARQALKATQALERTSAAPREPKAPNNAPEAPQRQQTAPDQTFIEFPDAHASKTARVVGMEEQALDAADISSREKVAAAVNTLVWEFRDRIKNDRIGRVRLYNTLRNELSPDDRDRFDDIVFELVHAFHPIQPKRSNDPSEVPF